MNELVLCVGVVDFVIRAWNVFDFEAVGWTE